MKTIKIKNKAYEAARKRFEKFGEEKADQHTWGAYQERRNNKLAEEKKDKIWMLQKALERHPDWTHEHLAARFEVSTKTI